MPTINELKKKALNDAGYTGSISDAEYKWLKEVCSPYVGSIPDMWRYTLNQAGYTGLLSDAQNKMLSDLGHTGALPNKWYKYWRDTPLQGGGLVPGRDLWLPGDILLDYDPSDLTTMFKDAAGTQPVTADGDSIALHLDKGSWGGKTLAQVTSDQAEKITNPDFDSDTAWSKSVEWAISGGLLIGTALSNASTKRAYQGIATTFGRLLRIEYEVTEHTGTGYSVVYGAAVNVTSVGIFRTGTGTFVEYIFAPAATTYIGVGSRGASTVATLSVARFSVKEIPGYHRLQTVGPSMPKYKTDGTLHWKLYDGSDDSDLTAAINWTTDEVACCVGLTKSSDAGAGTVFEFSAAVGVGNPGSFLLRAPRSAAATNFGWFSAGTSLADNAPSPFTAPFTGVVTAQGKISTDMADARVNGAAFPDADDQGTGTYGNHILYFGRRANSTLPFSGKEFRAVIRNRLWSSAELAKLEALIAAQSGVTL